MTAPRLTASERAAIETVAWRFRCAAEHLLAVPESDEIPDFAGSALAALSTGYGYLEDVCPDLPPWPTKEAQ